MGGTILAMLVMRNYSITEEKSKEISATLAKRKKETEKETTILKSN
jgi:Na+/melibiose symporter-like transporter